MSLSSKAKQFSSQKSDLDVIEFAESKQGFGIKLFPTQRFFLKLFDKIPLDTRTKSIEIRDKFNKRVLSTLTERDYYTYLQDNDRISLSYDDYYNSEFIQYMFSMGRRGTKSTTICIWVGHKLYKLLNIYHPQEYFEIISTDSMNVTMTALGQDNANKLFKKFYGIIKSSPFFRPFILEKPSTNHLKMWTQYDLDHITSKTNPGAHSNSIDIFSLPNTPGVRGDNNIYVIMDEFAHFANAAKSSREKPMDKLIFEALTPSVSGFKNPDGTPFGKTLILSSPNGKKGMFYSEYNSAFKLWAESGTLALRAPTWETNPKISPIYLEKEYAKNPLTFDQEFGAEFIEGGERWIKELGKFYGCFDSRLNHLQYTGVIDRKYFLGVDFALTNDGTAAVLSHYEKNYEMHKEDFPDEVFSYNGDLVKYFEENETLVCPRIVIDYAEVRYAGMPPWENQEVMLIDDVLDWIESLYLRWPIQYGIYDQWSGEIINQMVKSRSIPRLEMVNHTAAINDSQYKLFSMCMHQGQLIMPFWDGMTKELLALQCYIKNQGVIKVEAPPGPKNHDDLFSALIRSIYLCHAYIKKNKVLATSMPMLFKNGKLIKDTGVFKNIYNHAQYKKMQKIYHKTNTGREVRNARQLRGRRLLVSRGYMRTR